jgi:hypothetical protein
MKPKKGLVQLSGELGFDERTIDALLGSSGGDLDVIPPEVVQRVEALITATREKIDAYGDIADFLEDGIAAKAARIKHLQARKKAEENKLKRLKAAAGKAMELRNVLKLEGLIHAISRCRNGGEAPMELLVDEEEIPNRFKKQEWVLDTDALRAAVEAKDPEAIKCAEIKERGWHVEIE